MEMRNVKIQRFTDLNAWKEGHELVLIVYGITKKFPREEIFGLTSQMRRSVVSVTSNIAEGFCRQSYKEKTQFYCIALGSLSELQNQLYIGRDMKFISQEEFTTLEERSITVHKLLNGLIKSSRSISRSVSRPIIHYS